ncbi:MAG TPA: hypothetical protein VFE62_19950 [Gemmataceae bacterium]|nr:hypothetical protein [Gemmataceae bacterium]
MCEALGILLMLINFGVICGGVGHKLAKGDDDDDDDKTVDYSGGCG